jgi:hypothetical protein
VTSHGFIRSGLCCLGKAIHKKLAAGLLLMLVAAAPPIFWRGQAQATVAQSSARCAFNATRMAQADNDKQGEVPPEAITKYVAVYRDMQRDRGLTVEQAAAKEGMSLAEFRKLEGSIERNSPARGQARKELQAAAKGSVASPAPSPRSN